MRAGRPAELTIGFQGERSGVEPLSWGQLYSWGIITRTGVPMCIGGIRALPPTETLDDVAAATRFVMERHEALRTRFRLQPDGPPLQALADSGEIVVPLIDAGDEDPAVVAERVYDDYTRRNFDHEHEWPMRLAVIRRGDVLTHAVVAYSHMAMDGSAMNALNRDIVDNLRPGGGSRSDAPVPGRPPIDQARQQNSVAGKKSSAMALRSWEKHLRRIPARRFRGPVDPRQPRFWEVSFSSRALYLATGRVAARTGAGSSPVLLAAYAVALRRVTGGDPSAIQVMVSNHFRGDLAGTVSPLAQSGLCVIDVADAPFDDVVRQADATAMRAYLNAYYDPAALDELVARVGRERGEELDLSCYFNDRRFFHRQDPPADATPAGVVAARAHSELAWGHRMDRWNEKFFLHIDDAPDTVRLFACGDTHHVPPADIEAILRTMEDVVVTAA